MEHPFAISTYRVRRERGSTVSCHHLLSLFFFFFYTKNHPPHAIRMRYPGPPYFCYFIIIFVCYFCCCVVVTHAQTLGKGMCGKQRVKREVGCSIKDIDGTTQQNCQTTNQGENGHECFEGRQITQTHCLHDEERREKES